MTWGSGTASTFEGTVFADAVLILIGLFNMLSGLGDGTLRVKFAGVGLILSLSALAALYLDTKLTSMAPNPTITIRLITTAGKILFLSGADFISLIGVILFPTVKSVSRII